MPRRVTAKGRLLTGARIETACAEASRHSLAGRLLTGARIETSVPQIAWRERSSRLLTEARIETHKETRIWPARLVASSRGRGSKHVQAAHPGNLERSPPHGGADRNARLVRISARIASSPPHGGADRNGLFGLGLVARRPVASSRGRGSKHFKRGWPNGQWTSPPHGGADRNMAIMGGVSHIVRSPPHGGADRNRAANDHAMLSAGRLLTGARIETDLARDWINAIGSPPHGGADRNGVSATFGAFRGGRLLTGARIETVNRSTLDNTLMSPPHGGADRNSHCCPGAGVQSGRLLTGRGSKRARVGVLWDRGCRLLTGARIETVTSTLLGRSLRVASSRGRGSKRHCRGRSGVGEQVASSRGRGFKLGRDAELVERSKSPLTGTRIETRLGVCRTPGLASSRERVA